MPQTIKFYYPNEEFGEFSNFYVRPIEVNGVVWPVGTESYFQAMKSDDPKVQEYIRTQFTRPGQVKRYCHEQVALRLDWENSVEIGPKLMAIYSDTEGLVVDRVKDHFMLTALIYKFTQHKDLAEILLQTGDAHIIEDTQKVGSDPYWGNGPSGNGLNKLGRMLKLVRTYLSGHLRRMQAQPTK